mgnify:CR=1 FL=1
MARKSTKDFIDESNIVHNYKYDYTLVNYVNNIIDVKIICNEHGEFHQRPIHHLRGSGCKKCNNGRGKLKIEDVIKRFIEKHKDRYLYNKVIYTDIHKYVIITCKIHNDFLQTPNKHMSGRGCPKCGDRCGIKENKWLDFLGVVERQVRIGKYIVDGYDSITNTIYEFNGDFWHGNPNLYNPEDYNSVSKKTFGELYRNTINREKYLIKKGYNVISIWENDFIKQSY